MPAWIGKRGNRGIEVIGVVQCLRNRRRRNSTDIDRPLLSPGSALAVEGPGGLSRGIAHACALIRAFCNGQTVVAGLIEVIIDRRVAVRVSFGMSRPCGRNSMELIVMIGDRDIAGIFFGQHVRVIVVGPLD